MRSAHGTRSVTAVWLDRVISYMSSHMGGISGENFLGKFLINTGLYLETVWAPEQLSNADLSMKHDANSQNAEYL